MKSPVQFIVYTFAETLKPLVDTETQKSNVMAIPRSPNVQDKGINSAWRAFIQYCAELDHGEIELLKIQNGLPVLAEITRKKVKFG